MDVSAISQRGLNQAQTALEQAVDRLSSVDNPVDAVSLSREAVAVSEAHIQYSLSVKTLKIADEIAKICLSSHLTR